MWNNLFNAASAERAKNRIAASLEVAGDALTDLAKPPRATSNNGSPQQSAGGGATVVKIPPKEGETQQPSPPRPNGPNQFSSFLKNINHEKWLANTQRVLEQTKTVVQTQTQNISQSLSQNRSASGIKIRDPSLPLDTEALRDAEVVYITDRIVTMGHPAMQSTADPDITAPRKLAAVGQLMNKRHLGKYMVWNLSEVEYDYSLLNEQVLAYQFPGSPSPPLGLLLKLIFSMESWLKADPKNVAVLHCLTGKGRTSTVLACFLCWTGEAGFQDPLRALEYIALCKRCDVDQLTIPSQRRYVTYFSNMLDGVQPHHPPLILKRVILSDAPQFERAPSGKTEGEEAADAEMGCSPYIQLFKAGQLILTAAPTAKSANGEREDLPFCFTSEGSVTFVMETIIQGDILVRCRHLSQKGQRISMFRAAFHTGYTPPKVMRLTKAQLDGACTDRRFGDDFFVDLVFEACDTTTASHHLLRTSSTAVVEDQAKIMEATAKLSQNEAAARRARGAVEAAECAKSNVGLSATTYDTMLHRDSRFWDAIAARKQENLTRNSEFGLRAGPTIGRRRNSGTMKAKSRRGSSDSNDAPATAKANEHAASEPARSAMDAFTIGGGDFDFGGSDFSESQPSAQAPAAPPKKDDLMDALMALDDEEDIVFSHDEDDIPQAPVEEKAAAPPTAAPAVAEPVAPVEAVQETKAVQPEPDTLKEVPVDTPTDAKEVAVNGTNDAKPTAAEAPVAPEAVTPVAPKTEAKPEPPAATKAPAPAAAPAKKMDDDDLGLDDLDNEIDALMGDGGEDLDFDDDDDDLDDLEAFLTQG